MEEDENYSSLISALAFIWPLFGSTSNDVDFLEFVKYVELCFKMR